MNTYTEKTLSLQTFVNVYFWQIDIEIRAFDSKKFTIEV